jgi:AraC-like DNA-binding protein
LDRDGAVRGTLELGTLLGYRVGAFARDWHLLEDAVPALRARHPAAPVVLHIRADDPAAAVHYARRAAYLSVRAILVDDEPVAGTLRAIIPRPVNLSADVMEWLELRRAALPPECHHLVRAILRLAPEHQTVGSLLATIGQTEGAVRKRFHSRGVTPPSRWFAAARALHAALALQACPETPLLSTAWSLGYSDASALSRQMARVFDLRPSAARALLGWEALLDRWLTKEVGAQTSLAGVPHDRMGPCSAVRAIE